MTALAPPPKRPKLDPRKQPLIRTYTHQPWYHYSKTPKKGAGIFPAKNPKTQGPEHIFLKSQPTVAPLEFPSFTSPKTCIFSFSQTKSPPLKNHPFGPKEKPGYPKHPPSPKKSPKRGQGTQKRTPPKWPKRGPKTKNPAWSAFHAPQNTNRVTTPKSFSTLKGVSKKGAPFHPMAPKPLPPTSGGLPREQDKQQTPLPQKHDPPGPPPTRHPPPFFGLIQRVKTVTMGGPKRRAGFPPPSPPHLFKINSYDFPLGAFVDFLKDFSRKPGEGWPQSLGRLRKR
ncbi:hypothetical protein JTE90_007362 [Oedothorax gibbosus]|uniref:Uncharacterized protein n=1 Tax=Oedothorax gibbosus TaxID=931172 RepID=A0AAV6TCE0_9ARAC|nr:hypothetical protein JTE90_007362 [Oedothorax gibbosus]